MEMKLLKAAWDQATEVSKNVAKAPGWVPLAAFFYVAITWFTEEGKPIQGFDVRKNIETATVVLTATFYTLGDMLDEVVFNSWMKWYVKNDQNRVSEALGIPSGEGIYATSKAIAVAAKKYAGWIQVRNEAGKAARGIAVFMLVVTGILVAKELYTWAALAAVSTLLLFVAYPFLKANHMRVMYGLVADVLTQDALSYSFQDLPANESRLYFWDGVLVSSATTNPRTKKARQAEREPA